MKKVLLVITFVFCLCCLAAAPAACDVINAEYASQIGTLYPSEGTVAEAVAVPDDGNFIQMDVNSLIIMVFPGDYVAAPDDTIANDLIIDIYDALYPADANILVSADGLNWVSLGVHPDTTNIGIDLDLYVSAGIDVVKYVKVDQNGYFIDPNYKTLGFDLDAIVALNAIKLASIEKTFNHSDANLGDHVTVILDVNNPHDGNVVVIDYLAACTKYIPGTFAIDGNYSVMPAIMGSSIAVEVESGTHIITFDVQVVAVEVNDVVVENCAHVAPDLLSLPEDSNCAVLTLHPYEGFTKVVDDWGDSADTYACPTCVPIHEDIHWWLLIKVKNIAGDDIIDMNNIVVSDNFAGDLEVNDVNSFGVGDPNIAATTKGGKHKGGETEKIFLTWTVGDVVDGNEVNLLIEISTDINPGQGKKSPPKNEYTSTGKHCLNSGAVLKFTDPVTGFILSAHTPEICVWAYDPMSPDCPIPFTCP